MLRSEHSIIHYDFVGMRARPDRLRRIRDASWLEAADEILKFYRHGIQTPRQELHRQVSERLETLPGSVPRRIASFCKLLDEASEFHKASSDAAALRKRVFGLAASMHPIVQQREGIFEHTATVARQSIEKRLGLTWNEISDGMFADVIELQRLAEFDPALQAEQLLSRYNVAQTQAALYRANLVKLTFSEHAAFIVRMAKLAGLMHRVHRTETDAGPVYTMLLDGPGSVLRNTSRYGVRFSTLLPSLLCCDGWNLDARLALPNRQNAGTFLMRVSPKDGLRGEREEPEEFDSAVEREVEKQWRAAPVDGWLLRRDREFLSLGQQVYTPDFVLFDQRSRRRIFIEVLGFWTPEYLRDKRERLTKFSSATPGTSWLLIVDKKPSAAKQSMLDQLSMPVVVLRRSLKPRDWIAVATKE
ncbi:MAG: DUF790 family protein [Planctomycetota bacterium]